MRGVIICPKVVINWKREACSQDTRGTGNLRRAGASQVHGVLEVTEFLFRGRFKVCKIDCFYRLILIYTELKFEIIVILRFLNE